MNTGTVIRINRSFPDDFMFQRSLQEFAAQAAKKKSVLIGKRCSPCLTGEKYVRIARRVWESARSALKDKADKMGKTNGIVPGISPYFRKAMSFAPRAPHL